MEFSIPPFLAYVAAWGATIAGIGYLFEKAEDTVTGETQQAISRWLRNLSPVGALSNWPAMFAAVFDRVFGERHLSWRCFGRSCVASFAAVAIVILSFAAIQAEEFYLFRMLVAGLTNGASGEELFFLEVFLAPFFLAVVLNVVPDYVSLLETRYMILWMSRQRSSVRHMVLLLIDLAVTAAIGFMFIFGPYLLLMGSWPWEVPAFLWESIFTLSWEPFVRQTEAPFLPEGLFILLALGICFYSSFFTSVWVWLYALSGLAVRVVGYFGIGIRGLRGILDIESKPLRSMGFVSIALVSLLFLILPILR